MLLQPVIPTKLGWNLGKVFAEQDFLDQFQFGVPAFGLVRVLEAGEFDEVGNGLGAWSVIGDPDGEWV